MKFKLNASLDHDCYHFVEKEDVLNEIMESAKKYWNENPEPSQFEIFVNDLKNQYKNNGNDFCQAIVRQINKCICNK